MTELNVTTNTRDTTPMGMLRGWVGRGIGRTALVAVASLVALGPCHAGAEGTTAAGTLLVILGLGRVGAETQPLKVNLNMATQAELEKLGIVWANVKSGVFHREGEHWYGKTEQGKFMTEAEARKAGYRPAKEGAAGQKSATRAPG
ncbi:MAG TPA: hypothetical protein VK754_05000 [Propionibacteriaceae bacterium]|nr:hypothetical protein [Propionibacteriaceae bacterium]